jgi:hypothetical protein
VLQPGLSCPAFASKKTDSVRFGRLRHSAGPAGITGAKRWILRRSP